MGPEQQSRDSPVIIRSEPQVLAVQHHRFNHEASATLPIAAYPRAIVAKEAGERECPQWRPGDVDAAKPAPHIVHVLEPKRIGLGEISALEKDPGASREIIEECRGADVL